MNLLKPFLQRRYLSLAFIFLFHWDTSYAQLEKDYITIGYSSSIPADFSENYAALIDQAVNSETSISKSKAKEFYKNLYYTKSQLFSSGNIYFNNKLQEYVNKVTQKALESNQDLLRKTRVYVSRSTVANAFAMADGTIIINLGLLARIENESQLAAIIAHEAAHVEKKHSIKSLQKIENIKKQQDNYENYEGDIYRMLRFSREDESESDSRAVQLIMASKYDPKEIPVALSILNNRNYFKLDSIELTIKKTFLKEIDVDTSWFQYDQFAEEDTQKKSDLVFSGGSDDRFSTHPDMGKRISAVNEILNLVEYDKKSHSVNLFGKESSEIQSIAIFECIENMLIESEFNSALYLSLYYNQKYPNNIYLKTAIIRSLYWLSYYKEINCLTNVIENSDQVVKSNFGKFNYFLENIPHNDLKKAMFNYVKTNLESCQSKDEYFFYYGLSSEMYLGKDPGRIIFNQYLLKFPNGKYTTTVNAKLK